MKNQKQLMEEFTLVLEKASNGNQEALHCMRLASTYFHTFDDLVDRDIELSAFTFSNCNNLFLKLILNPFFLQHNQLLGTILLLISDDYIASNEEDKYWNNLRHCGNTFFKTVALLTGGDKLMLEVGRMLRQCSMDSQVDNLTIL